jgi:hypothetical protein
MVINGLFHAGFRQQHNDGVEQSSRPQWGQSRTFGRACRNARFLAANNGHGGCG